MVSQFKNERTGQYIHIRLKPTESVLRATITESRSVSRNDSNMALVSEKITEGKPSSICVHASAMGRAINQVFGRVRRHRRCRYGVNNRSSQKRINHYTEHHGCHREQSQGAHIYCAAIVCKYPSSSDCAEAVTLGGSSVARPAPVQTAHQTLCFNGAFVAHQKIPETNMNESL